MTRKKVIVITLIICLILIVTVSTIAWVLSKPELDPVSMEKNADMQKSLEEFLSIINKDMKGICSLTEDTASELSGLSLDDPAVELALLALHRDIPASYETWIVDKNNTVCAITGPIVNQQFIGKQAPVNTTDVYQQNCGENYCAITSLYTFRDGNEGILILAPIYGTDGTYTGMLCVGLDPAYLFSGHVDQLRADHGYTIWATQPDGTLIYYEDTEAIGKNILTGEIYTEKSSHNVAQQVTEKTTGNASYMYYNVGWTEYSQINAVWDTLTLPNGREWRVSLTDAVSRENPDNSVQLTPEYLKTFVEKAYVYAQTHTKEEALRAFNDPDGEFIDGELYIFAYDMNGTALALPYQDKLVGVNRMQAEDIIGVKYVERGIARVKQGGGYIFFQYPNPDKDFARELKLTYAMPVDNDWCIGAGFYIQNTTLAPCGELRDEMVSQVRNFQYLSKIMPEDELISLMNNPNSSIQVKGLYPFASTINGTILSYTMDPSCIGNNHLGYVNSYGMSMGREAISLTQSGGGMIYGLVWDPDLQREVYVLFYVELASEDTYYGSMIILGDEK